MPEQDSHSLNRSCFNYCLFEVYWEVKRVTTPCNVIFHFIFFLLRTLTRGSLCLKKKLTYHFLSGEVLSLTTHHRRVY